MPRLKLEDVVVLDDLKPRCQSSVRRAIRQVGANMRFLPPYSSDFNPIEELWSKVKSLICAKRPQTVEEVRRACQWAFPHITLPRYRRLDPTRLSVLHFVNHRNTVGRNFR